MSQPQVSVQQAFDDLRSRIVALEHLEAATAPSEQEKQRFQWLIQFQASVTDDDGGGDGGGGGGGG